MSIRLDAVAGQFYPSNPKEIESMVHHYNDILDKNIDMNTLESKDTRSVIVPHAGYIYSAFTANIAIRMLGAKNPKSITVIGPSHRVYLSGVSLCDYDRFETPLGDLKIDRPVVEMLKSEFGLRMVSEAHHEHSTEVQMPLIKYYMPDTSVVELVCGDVDPDVLSIIIEKLLNDPNKAVVISTDLSHYYDIDKANRLDAICLEAIDYLDRLRLHQGCEACGKIGVEAMIVAAKNLSLKPEILDYRTSADASQDKTQVVGYASAAFIKEDKG